MRKRAFTMVEMLVVVMIVAILVGTLSKVLSSTFTGAQKGFDTLTLLQENSKLIASLKQDMRTLIIGGIDNIPAPDVAPISPGQNDNTDSLEFFRVWNIHESGRPLSLKISYRRDISAPGKPFGVTRTTGSGAGSDPIRQFVPGLLTRFRVELLDSRGNVISTQANSKDLKKVRLTLESKGTELLSSTVSIYSPYIKPVGTVSPNELWLNNYLCVYFQPGAAVRLCEGGVIQGTTLIPLGTPLALNGETPIVTPP